MSIKINGRVRYDIESINGLLKNNISDIKTTDGGTNSKKTTAFWVMTSVFYIIYTIERSRVTSSLPKIEN